MLFGFEIIAVNISLPNVHAGSEYQYSILNLVVSIVFGLKTICLNLGPRIDIMATVINITAAK